MKILKVGNVSRKVEVHGGFVNYTTTDFESLYQNSDFGIN